MPKALLNESHPLTLLPGGGLAGSLKDCTEIGLSNRNIEKLAGFERLTNLEILWLDHNQLRCISNLDSNIRIKQLYVHNNRICTLKGSLAKFKFLTHLDLSYNQLKHLGKTLAVLQKLRFLQELNLQGNQCCEEPQYRLIVLAALPTLKVLDHHEVTILEREQAARVTVAGDVKPQAVAFGSHIPEMSHKATIAAAAAAAVAPVQSAPAAAGGNSASLTQQQHQQQQQQKATKQKNFSVLERELEAEVEAIRQKRQDAAAAAEAALYARNPDAAYWEPRSTLPPNPALVQAQKTWAEATATRQGSLSGLLTCEGNRTAAAAAGAGGKGDSIQELASKGYLQGTFSYRTRGPGTKVKGCGTTSRGSSQVLCC